jgi:hypothetical protein
MNILLTFAPENSKQMFDFFACLCYNKQAIILTIWKIEALGGYGDERTNKAPTANI